MIHRTLTLCLIVALATGAFAQGDDCSTATATSGHQALTFDTSLLTTSGFNGGPTCPPGASTINQDAFYQWTATAAGNVVFNTFGSSFDTQVSVHAGVGCAATCSRYNGDTGGLQSRIYYPGVNIGDTFLVQVGGYNVDAGIARLNIVPPSDPCAALDDMLEGNDDCTNAIPMVDGLTPGLRIFDLDLDHYALTVASGATLDVIIFFTHSIADVDLFLWDAASVDCGTGNTTSNWLARGDSSTNDEVLTWTNSTGTTADCIIEVRMVCPSGCNDYDLQIMGSTPRPYSGVAFCNPAKNNSSGQPTRLMGSMTAPGGSGLHLEADQGPAGKFGYYLVGTASNQPGISIVWSAGRFCLHLDGGHSIGRYILTGTQFNSLGRFDASGIHQNLVGTSSVGSGFDVPATVPISGSPTIMPGSTWHFQFWHRETGGASNLSNGQSCQF